MGADRDETRKSLEAVQYRLLIISFADILAAELVTVGTWQVTSDSALRDNETHVGCDKRGVGLSSSVFTPQQVFEARGRLICPSKTTSALTLDVGRRRKNQLDEESMFKRGNWAEGEGRGGVVGKCVAVKSIVSARAWHRKGPHGLSRHQSHDWAQDESMGSVGLKMLKFSTKYTTSVC